MQGLDGDQGPAQQLLVGDEGPERGVLEDHHELADQSRQHRAERLWQQDDPQRLAVGEAQRRGRVTLPLRHREDAGSDDLGDDHRVVGGQTDHDVPQRRQLQPVDRENLRRKEDRDHHGHAAQQLDRPDHGPPVPSGRGDPGRRDEHPEQQGEGHRQGGGGQGVHQTAAEQAPQVREVLVPGVEQRTPPAAVELAVRRQPADGQHRQADQHDTGDNAGDSDPSASPRARGVVENRAAHRATRSRFSAASTSRPAGMTMTR